MQYLDITGTPVPKPQNWARGKKAPKWWTETLEQEHEPLKLSRKPVKDCFERFAFLRTQWSPTWAECVAALCAEGKAPNPQQASFDLSQRMLSGIRVEHIERAALALPEGERAAFVRELMAAGDAASVHSEMAGDEALETPCE